MKLVSVSGREVNKKRAGRVGFSSRSIAWIVMICMVLMLFPVMAMSSESPDSVIFSDEGEPADPSGEPGEDEPGEGTGDGDEPGDGDDSDDPDENEDGTDPADDDEEEPKDEEEPGEEGKGAKDPDGDIDLDDAGDLDGDLDDVDLLTLAMDDLEVLAVVTPINLSGNPATDGGPGWSWVGGTTRTLTLTELDMNVAAGTAISLPTGATVELIGTNTITAPDGYGISFASNGTICGSGTLTITSDEASIYCDINLTISDTGKITITSNRDGISVRNEMLIKNSDIRVINAGRTGINAGWETITGDVSITIINSTINIDKNGGGYNSGIRAEGDLIIDNSTVIISDSEAIGIDTSWGGGIEIINNSTVTIKAEDIGIKSSEDIKINNGIVTISSQFEGIETEGNVYFNGGTVTITSEFYIAVLAASIFFNGGSGSIQASDGSGHCAVLALNENTLGVGDKMNVWEYDHPETPATKKRIGHEEKGLSWTFVDASDDDRELSGISYAAYTVTVVRGTLKGGKTTDAFKSGETVHITANDPPEGQEFDKWVIATVPAGVTLTFLNDTSVDDHDVEFTMPTAFVTATATFRAKPPGNFLITVNHTGNGTANAVEHSAPAGATVTLRATPDAGNRFVRWEVVSGDGVIFANAAAATTTFVMPDNDVTINAVFATTTAISPQTGDNSNTIFPTIVLAFCIAGVFGTALLRRRYIKQHGKW